MYPGKAHKIIYSKRFPHQELEDILESQGIPDDLLPAEPDESFQAFCRRIEENSICISRPDKQAERERFINLAVNLSESYEIDMEITDYFYHISVTMYLNCASCSGELKSLFTKLIVMCDRISSFISRSDPCDFIISLEYNTHDHYIS